MSEVATAQKNEQEEVPKSSLETYKTYSKRVNKTLTTFANEMSELLRESIEQLDDISLKVRGCVFDMENQERIRELKKMKVLHQIEKNNKAVPIVETESTTKVKSTRAMTADSTSRRSKPENLLDSKKCSSSVAVMAPNSKKISAKLNSLKQEVNVMNQIKLTHKKISDRGAKEHLVEPIDSTLEMLKRRYTARPKRKCRKKASTIFLGRERRDAKGQFINKTYVDENFDDNLWFGPKLTTQKVTKKHEVRNTKLSRKYASENFHDLSTTERKCPSDCGFMGKSLRLTPDKSDWCVIMHTSKNTPKCELKQQKYPLAVNNILDDITLKDLEPLKAEYPRKDNLQQLQDHSYKDNLLHRLVNDKMSRSLQLLISSSTDDTMKRKIPKKRVKSRQFEHRTIPEEEPTHNDNESMNISIKESALPSPCQQVRKMLVEKRRCDSNTDMRSITYHQYQMYKKLAKRDTRQRLKKYLIDPHHIPKQKFIVMPVLVEYEQNVVADVVGSGEPKPATSLDETENELFTPREFLEPYIYVGDFNETKTHKSATTIMTMTVQHPPSSPPQLRPRRYSLDRPQQELASYKNIPQNMAEHSIDGNESISTEATTSSGVVNTLYKRSDVRSRVERSPPKDTECENEAIKGAIEDIENKLKRVMESEPHCRRSMILNSIEHEMETLFKTVNIKKEDLDNSPHTKSRYRHMVQNEKLQVQSKAKNFDSPSLLTRTKTLVKQPTPQDRQSKSYDYFNRKTAPTSNSTPTSKQFQTIFPERTNKMRTPISNSSSRTPTQKQSMTTITNKDTSIQDIYKKRPTPPPPRTNHKIVNKILNKWQELENPKMQDDKTILSKPSSPKSASSRQSSAPKTISSAVTKSDIRSSSPHPKQATVIRGEKKSDQYLPKLLLESEKSTRLPLNESNTFKTIEEIESRVDQETIKFCDQVHEIIHQDKITDAQYTINSIQSKTDVVTKSSLTLFEQAVKKYHKEEKSNNFQQFLDKLEKHKIATIRTTSQLAFVKYLISEEYIIQNLEKAISVSVALPQEKPTKEKENVNKQIIKDSKWLGYGNRSGEIESPKQKTTIKKDLETKKKDEDRVHTPTSPPCKVKSVKDEATNSMQRQKTIGLSTMMDAPIKVKLTTKKSVKINCSPTENVKTQTQKFAQHKMKDAEMETVVIGDARPSFNRSNYDTFLMCIYGFMFATVFCGLNLRYSCVS